MMLGDQSLPVPTVVAPMIMLHHCSCVTGLTSHIVRRHVGDRSKVFDMA